VLIVPALVALSLWLAVLVLPPRAYRVTERIGRGHADADLNDITVLIPARNEAAYIERTLTALGRQGHGLEVRVVDDHSEDATVAAANAAAVACLRARSQGPAAWSDFRLQAAPPLPSGWSGKLWALQHGLATVERRYTLLMDADIELAPGMIEALLGQARRTGATLVSVMARLRCESAAERLLVPPFVFFFKLLYPFARVNDPASPVAAAAGGCMLVTTEALRAIGGFGAIHGELIDDCALARRIKRSGGRLWLGQSDDVRSHRSYERFRDFWGMVTRTAFTELRYSAWRLLLASGALVLAFVVPPATVLLAPDPTTRLVGAASLLAMAGVFFPVARFYGQPLRGPVTLPLAALAYLAMTWGSAVGYWRGVRARWKNRAYETL
jgi:hopene-associated glycosyltransferase HpnB